MLAIAVMLVPLPLMAADRAAAPSAHPLKTAIARHAEKEVLVSAPQHSDRRATQTRAQDNSPRQGSSFFRSPAGVACLAVLAAGTGYAIYSANHDRIHSVARQGQ